MVPDLLELGDLSGLWDSSSTQAVSTHENGTSMSGLYVGSSPSSEDLESESESSSPYAAEDIPYDPLVTGRTALSNCPSFSVPVLFEALHSNVMLQVMDSLAKLLAPDRESPQARIKITFMKSGNLVAN